MGGVITTAFAARFTYLVDGKIALVCPVGLLENEHIPMQVKLIIWPVMDFSNSFVAQYLARSRIRKMSRNRTLLLHIQLVKIQMERLPGYLQAIFSSFRHGPV